MHLTLIDQLTYIVEKLMEKIWKRPAYKQSKFLLQ